MNKERPQPPAPFVFSEHETLFNRISDGRLQALLADDRTTIHTIQPDSNRFGDFLFVTVSRPGAGEQQYLTFYGYGYHQYRERWYTQEWTWFQAHPFPETQQGGVSREEAEARLQARRDEIAPDVRQDTQTGRGRLYELVADLTDEDGALTEMEDLGELWDDLSDDLDDEP